MKTIPQDYEQKINLNELTNGSLLHGIATAKINYQGFYSCMWQNKKTIIVK